MTDWTPPEGDFGGPVNLPDVKSGEGLTGRLGRVSPETQAARDQAASIIKASFERPGDEDLRNPAKPKEKTAVAWTPPASDFPVAARSTWTPGDIATSSVLASGQPNQVSEGQTTGDMSSYVANQTKLGLASGLGFAGAVESALPGAKAAVNKALGISPDSTLGQLDQITSFLDPATLVQRAIVAGKQAISPITLGPQSNTVFPTPEQIASPLGYNPNLKPADKAQEIAGDFATFMGSMVGPGGIGKSAGTKVLSVLKDAGFPMATNLVEQTLGQVAKSTLLETAKAAVPAGAAVAGGEAAQAAFGEGTATKALGQIVGGIVPAGYILARANLPQYFSDLKGVFTGGLKAMEPVVEQKARNVMATGMNEFPASFANAQEAGDLAKRVNQALAEATPEGAAPKSVVLSPGQMTAAPKIIANEIAARGSTPAYIAAAVDRDAMNTAALLDYMRNDNSPAAVSRRTVLNQVQAGVNAQFDALKAQEDQVRQRAQALAESVVPSTTAEERGQVIAAQRDIEKATRFDPAKNVLFGRAEAAFNEANARFEPDSINAISKKLTSDPVLGYDPANLPSVVRLIKAKTQPVEDALVTQLRAQGYSDALIQKMGLPPAAAPPLTYADISAMRRAVNDDIRGELAKMPIGTQGNQSSRVRALQEMKDTIDSTIAQSPYPEAVAAYNAAVDHYRNIYAPAIKEGINARLALMSSDGRARVLDEKVLDQYMTPTGSNEFLRLFGQNPVAMSTMRDHIMDRLGQTAIVDGVLDPKKMQAFLAKNLPTLEKLKTAGLPVMDAILDARSAAQALGERFADIRANYKALADDKLTRLFGTADMQGLAKSLGASFISEAPRVSGNFATIVEQAVKDPYAMIRLVKAAGPEGSKALAESILGDIGKKFTFTQESGRIGIDHKAFSDWLNESQRSLAPLFRAAYGAKEGQEHLQRLLEANRLLAIQQRVPIGKIQGGVSDIGKDPLAQSTGISLKNIWNVYKAVSQGRQNEMQGALSLGGPMMSHMMVKSYNQLMQRIASDPESSKYLLQLAREGGKPTVTKASVKENTKAILGLLGKAGYIVAGGKFYGPALMQLAPGVAAQATQGVQ